MYHIYVSVKHSYDQVCVDNCVLYSFCQTPEVVRGGNRPLGPSSLVASGCLGGSGMLQSVPAQVVSQVHVASLLHTCADQTGRDEADFMTEGNTLNKSCRKWSSTTSANLKNHRPFSYRLFGLSQRSLITYTELAALQTTKHGLLLRWIKALAFSFCKFS